MPRYFRCEEPGGQCSHARTRAVLADVPGVCPLDHPDCGQWRRPVPLLTALRERNPVPFWGVIGVAGLVAAALMLSLLLGGMSWRGDLSRLETALTGLNDRLKPLEAASSKSAVDPDQAWEAFVEAGQVLRDDVRKAVIAKATAEAAGLLARLDDLEQQQRTLLGAAGSDPKGARAQAAATQLVKDYQGLKADVSVAQAAAPADDEVQHAFRTLAVNVDRGLKRAQRLAAPVPPAPVPPRESADVVIAALGEARDGLDILSASVSIATNPVLARALVLPLLKSCVVGGTVRPASDERHWFIGSQEPPFAPGALVGTADPDDLYRLLFAERADLVIADQTPDQQTQAEFSARFPGQAITARDHAAVIALDAVALLGHPTRTKSPVTDLSRDPWSTDAASGQVITRLVPSLSVTLVEDPFATVQSDPGGLSAVLHHQLVQHPVAQLLAYQPSPEAPALKPSDFSIGTENYPLSYRVLAMHSPQSRPSTRDLLKCMTSDVGQSAVKTAGFVDLRLLAEPAQSSADPLILSTLGRAVGRNVTRAQQYPTSLRFALNKAELDVKAVADVERLSQPLQAKIAQGSRIVILGFTDNTGTEPDNVRLSIERARQVSEQLTKVGVSAVNTAGLGQQLPVDTNDSEAGRARNRRAEVWVVEVEP